MWLLLSGSVCGKLFHYTRSRPSQAQNPAKDQESVTFKSFRVELSKKSTDIFVQNMQIYVNIFCIIEYVMNKTLN